MLTVRERKIILICQVLLNPVTKNEDFDSKVQLVRVALQSKNIEFNSKELTALIHLIKGESDNSIKAMMEGLQRFGFNWKGYSLK